MTDRVSEFQTAIGDLISADGTLTSLGITGVFTNPPSNATFPYITIGDIDVAPQETKDQDWFMYRMNINSWDKKSGTVVGQKRSRDILSRLGVILHDTRLTLSSGCTPAVYQVRSFVQLDPDRVTQHGIFVLRAQD